jgi:hypothetical protein
LHFEVNDIEAVVQDLTSRGVTFEEYETPKTVNFIAQSGPARNGRVAQNDHRRPVEAGHPEAGSRQRDLSGVASLARHHPFIVLPRDPLPC